MNLENFDMAQLTEIGRVKNGVIYKDAKGNKLVRIDNVRVSFPYLGTPSEDESDDGDVKKSWRITGMLFKKTHVEVKDAVKAIFNEIMAANDTKVPTTNWALVDGDGEKYQEEKYEMNHGHWLLSAKDHTRKPPVRNQRGELVESIDKIDDMIYGGCWCNILVRPWYFSGKTKNSKKTYPKRMLCGLEGVQFLKDDEPFGQGRIDESNAWDNVETAGSGGDGMGGDDDGL
jgi:Protein of unknown function (DUF2815)